MAGVARPLLLILLALPRQWLSLQPAGLLLTVTVQRHSLEASMPLQALM